MTGFRTRGPHGGGGIRFPFIGAVLGLAGLGALIGLVTEPDEPAPAPRIIPLVSAPVEEFKPHFVAVSQAYAIAEHADADTRADAEAAAQAKCETIWNARLKAGAYVAAGGCQISAVMENVLGPACGIVMKNNIVHNVPAVILTGPNAFEVERDARAYIRSADAAGLFDSAENPRMSAMRYCVARNGEVKVTDLSYELAR